MSGETITTKTETFKGSPGAFPVVLQNIMEMPPPNLLEGDDGKSICFCVGVTRTVCYRQQTEKRPNCAG